MTNRTILIVDDEPLARKRIRDLLVKMDGYEVVAEAGDGHEGIAAVKKHRPDLLFLDIQMPELDGFEMLSKISDEQLPVVIFVTAYDKYALQAFEAHAIDYLLKPFDDERFYESLERAQTMIRAKQPDNQEALGALLETLKMPQPRYQSHFAIRTNDRAVVVQSDSIEWVESASNYVRLHVGAESHLLRETMNAMEDKLNPGTFVRIHRSTMVNLNQIKELHPWSHGDYVVLLHNGQKLRMSRSYRERLRDRLGNYF